MTFHRLKILLTIALIASSVPAVADELGSTLPDRQQKVFEAFQLTPAFAKHGISHIDKLLTAQETLRRYGLLQKCTAAANADPDALLDRGYRLAVEQTAANIHKLILQDHPENLRYMLRRALWASDELTSQEAAIFLADRGKPSGLRAFVALAEITFLEQFDNLATDINSGKVNPAAVIWLKDYFRAEGDLQALEAAVAAVLPSALADFRRVSGFAAHSMADAVWLAPLTEQLQASSAQLSAAMLARKPAADRTAAAWLVRLPFVYLNSAELAVQHPDNELGAQTLGLGLPRSIHPELVSEYVVRKAAAGIAKAYPRPADFAGRLAVLGPVEMVGHAADALCPKP